MILLSFVLSFFAFAHLAMVTKRHSSDCLGRASSIAQRRLLHAIAWPLMWLSTLPCTQLWGMEIGLTVWFGVITISSLFVAAWVSLSVASFRRFWQAVCPGGWLLRFVSA